MNKKLYIVIFTFLLFVLLGMIVAVVKTRTSFLGQAAGERIHSLEDSYLFGSPLVAQADGEDKIKIIVFLLDKQGRGVQGKEAQVSSSPSLTIEPVQSQTDKYGQATFETVSNSSGQFVVSASVDGQSLSQTVTLTFK